MAQDRPAADVEALDVLIVGAGPTGLSLAVALRRLGTRVRLIEKNEGPSRFSKALVIQPRTLEVFHQLGVVDPVLCEAQPVFRVQPRERGKALGTIAFGDVDGPYPRPVMLRQSRTEHHLADRLKALDVAVEWGVELVSFEHHDRGAQARLSTGETVHCRFLVGCDGSHSRVRKQLDIPFEGTSYNNDFLQVDCRVDWSGPYDSGVGFLRDDGLMACIPLGDGMFRFILIRRHRPDDAPEQPELEEFQAVLDQEAPGARLFDVEWIIRFRLHERLARRFRIGRCFLAGDAAHIHTPAGGQGMNTGIQDAHNLAWKLHAALAGRGGEALLDSYELERRPIADAVLRATDRAFRTALGARGWVRRLRRWILPLVLRNPRVRRELTRRVAQLNLHVRQSPLVEDLCPWRRGPRAGERAPDAMIRDQGGERRIFDVLRSTKHVVFAYAVGADALAELSEAIESPQLEPVAALQRLDESRDVPQRYGLGREPAIWVVRPDGYLGFRQSGDDPAPGWGFLSRF